MKIHGYCEKCHRFKLVRVNAAGMARMVQFNQPSGICDDCDESQNVVHHACGDPRCTDPTHLRKQRAR